MTRTWRCIVLGAGSWIGLYACGSDKSTAPVNHGPPSIATINGVTKPSGLIGMTVIVEGSDFAEPQGGSVFFRAADGSALRAIVNAGDWTDTYIVTTVPQGTATTSKVWVTTAAGTSDSLDFLLISGNTFNPSNIDWVKATDLPDKLQGLGAAFVPVERGSAPAKYIFTIGGATDGANVSTSKVFRGSVQETGAIASWDQNVTRLPFTRAYHATAVATPYTARLDTLTAGYLYAIGGIDSTGTAVSTVLYAKVALDGSVGAWQTGSSLPAPTHSAAATVYRGFLYVTGGADSQNRPIASAYRAAVAADGSLGAWQPISSLAKPTAHHGLVNFGPYLYAVGGDTGTVTPVLSGMSGTETAAGYLAKIDMRTGDVTAWTSTAAASKARSKHGVMSAGASVVITSGVYSGQAGSSENSYASINSDGSLTAWAGATGVSTIQSLLGYSLYNQAAVSFVDANGQGHVIVLGGANRASAGQASAGVVYY